MSYIKLSEQLVEKHRQENIEMVPMIERIMMLGLAMVPRESSQKVLDRLKPNSINRFKELFLK